MNEITTIQGWSEPEVVRLPRLGMIAIGQQVAVKGRPGSLRVRALDHFVINPSPANNQEAMDAFREVYGDRPRSLEIIIPFHDIDQALTSSLKRYGRSGRPFGKLRVTPRGVAGRLLCTGDGQTARRYRPRRGQFQETNCPYRDCAYYQRGDCQEITVFSFLLPQVRGLGIWQIDTGSFHSTRNLRSAMVLLQAMGLRLPEIPLKLTVEPMKIFRRKQVYVLNLRYDGAIGSLSGVLDRRQP